MNRILNFVQKERLYILLLIFIILLNVFVLSYPGEKSKKHPVSAKPETAKLSEDFFMKPADAEKLLSEKKYLAVMFGLTSLLILAAFFLGTIIDAIIVNLRLSGRKLDILTNELPAVRWNIWDVAKVAILFLFFGYMVVIMESFVSKTWPFMKNDNLRMIFNSSVLDALTIVFILYFSVWHYKERLVSLGLSLKNFARNVYYGALGYLAAVPVLVGTLAIIALILHITKYVPEKQPVVELFLKEENTAFLAYTTIFAAGLGPVVEELFFRAFMYGALKKYIGVFWSILITAGLFAALHTNIVGFMPIMVLGITLAYIYEKTGTLVAPITLHMIHNFTMLLFVFLVKQLKA